MFERQIFQIPFTLLAAWVLYRWSFTLSDAPSLLGISPRCWFQLSFVTSIVHHSYVWFCWRAQLHHQWMTRWLGSKALDIYAFGFFALALSRVASLITMALADGQSLSIPPAIRYAGLIVTSLLSAYAMYSVARYFGMKRATGADHFEEKYRTMPLVREGIFKYTRNGMYNYALLMIWIPGLATQSKAALVLAAFNLAYIWVHYFCLEKPDMARIYGGR